MNAEGLFAGSSNTPLTDTGIKQAIETGNYIRDHALSIDVIISSPLSRAHDTARYIASQIAYDHEHIIILDDLVERHFGALEGTSSELSPISRETHISDPFALDTVADIEKVTDLQYRANRVLQHLQSLPYETILIVGHGASGRALERAAKNMHISEYGTSLANAQLLKFI
jgi:uncharacterized phosphatase